MTCKMLVLFISFLKSAMDRTEQLYQSTTYPKALFCHLQHILVLK